eukprot:1175384-Prorocentrum_minimum.AAC.1
MLFVTMLMVAAAFSLRQAAGPRRTVLLQEFANPPGMEIIPPGNDPATVGAVLKQVQAQPWLLDARETSTPTTRTRNKFDGPPPYPC